MSQAQPRTCEVLVVGGGASGLLSAIELGRWEIDALVVDDKLGPSRHPQANANSARTMEHYRRLGFASEFRALGMPDDHATDVTYFSTFGGYEIARFEQPSRARALEIAGRHETLGTWHTPELPHRCSQLYLEPLLAEHARAQASVDLEFGWSCGEVVVEDDHVRAVLHDVRTGETREVRAEWLLACDGPRSGIRRQLGISLRGKGGVVRDFLGGQMVSVFLRAPDFHRRLAGGRSWQHWSLAPGRRSILTSINGVDTYSGHVQLAPGEDISDAEALRRVVDTFGFDTEVSLISATRWTAGNHLVAERYRSGRAILVGDAAHVFTPAGGMGYNTGVDDVANLAWKLAAVIRRFGDPGIIDTYEQERRPAALRNMAFSTEVADVIGSVSVPPDVDEPTRAAAAGREALRDELLALARFEFDIPGIQLGLRYDGSPLVVDDGSEPTPDDPNVFVPTARPGARLPHVWLRDGRALFDTLGMGFTVLLLGPGADPSAFTAAAERLGVPLAVVQLGDEPDAKILDAPAVLVRPDQHVVWRGDLAGADASAILATALGRTRAPGAPGEETR